LDDFLPKLGWITGVCGKRKKKKEKRKKRERFLLFLDGYYALIIRFSVQFGYSAFGVA
jgi:hypothetical protein